MDTADQDIKMIQETFSDDTGEGGQGGKGKPDGTASPESVAAADSAAAADAAAGADGVGRRPTRSRSRRWPA